MPGLILILENIRSAHNVGSVFRTADAAGIECIILTGYTPFPTVPQDPRLPHVAERATRQIAKTSLGAEKTVPFYHVNTTREALLQLRNKGYLFAALEITANSKNIFDAKTYGPIALILGNEETGVESETLQLVDYIWHIPMRGDKKSLNVSVAAGIAAYHLSLDSA